MTCLSLDVLTTFTWTLGGNTVFVTGTFTDWTNHVPLQRDGHIFTTTIVQSAHKSATWQVRAPVHSDLYSATSSLLMESGGSRQRTPLSRTHRGTSITISIRPIIRRCPRMLSRVSPAPVRRSVHSWRIKRTKLWSPSSSLTKPHQSYQICSLHAHIWM